MVYIEEEKGEVELVDDQKQLVQRIAERFIYTQRVSVHLFLPISTRIPATMLEALHGSKFPKLHRTSMNTSIHYTCPHFPPSKQMF